MCLRDIVRIMLTECCFLYMIVAALYQCICCDMGVFLTISVFVFGRL